MPSFRVTMTIGALRPGIAPPAVAPTAANAAAELTVVEASDVTVVAGAARLTVRFTAEDAELAMQIGEHVAAATDAAARVIDWKLTERVGARWYRR